MISGSTAAKYFAFGVCGSNSWTRLGTFSQSQSLPSKPAESSMVASSTMPPIVAHLLLHPFYKQPMASLMAAIRQVKEGDQLTHDFRNYWPADQGQAWWWSGNRTGSKLMLPTRPWSLERCQGHRIEGNQLTTERIFQEPMMMTHWSSTKQWWKSSALNRAFPFIVKGQEHRLRQSSFQKLV